MKFEQKKDLMNCLIQLQICLFIVVLLSCSFTAKPAFQRSDAHLEPVKINEDNVDAIDNFFAQELTLNDIDSLPGTIKIIATGDLMLGTRFPDETYLPEISGYDLFNNDVKEILQKGDITFGNLEGVISSNDGKPKKKKYIFAMPDEAAFWLNEAGFNLLSVANNHALDLGEEGRLNTIRNLQAADLEFAGYLSQPTSEIIRDGIRIGFVAASPNSGVVYLHDLQKIIQYISDLEARNDIVIVSMHIGAEGSDHQHITGQEETFLGENRGNPYQFARDVIDAGADLVLGHGPHVTRAVDLYKGRFIAYSMGNFCTISRVNLRDVNGIAPILELDLSQDGEFLLGKIHAAKQIPRKGVLLDEQLSVLKKIMELTEEDFPESPLYITDQGLIIPK